jgi:HEPN domain-containing protein
MSRPEAERARSFLERADADLAAVHAMEDLDTVPDEIVGFHCQQAAEKLLKGCPRST